MASGTQNLPSQIYNKTQNNQITVNGVGNYSASHLLYSVIIITKYFLIQKASHWTSICLNHLPPTIISSYSIYFTCILYFLCLLVYSRFQVFHLILLHDRHTSAPPVFVSLFTAAWADVAECVQKPCLRHAFCHVII